MISCLESARRTLPRHMLVLLTLSCAASLENENQALKDQLEEITCKFVKLQGTHIELEYSHERLVESHTLLEVANEVLVNSIKSYTPLCTTSTCTQVEDDISCANPCGPKRQTFLVWSSNCRIL
jgi:hypothetical protein